MLLADLGWTPVWHFVGPGRHGVDLLMLGPNAERLFAIEVKGTLRPRRWPARRPCPAAQVEEEVVEMNEGDRSHDLSPDPALAGRGRAPIFAWFAGADSGS